MILALFSVAVAYLLGSISSAYVVGRLAGNLDIRDEPDGRISAATIYYRVGPFSYFCVVIMDISIAVVAVVLARALTDSTNMMMISGIAAVAGHNWSIFLKFKGGLGATAIAGTLAAVITWQLSYGLLTAGIILWFTHKPGLSTALGIVAISVAILLQDGIVMLSIYPLVLLMLMSLKKLQVGKKLVQAEYQKRPL